MLNRDCLKGNIFITAGKATAAACGVITNKLLPERQDYMFYTVLLFRQR